jgi:hypothetical protein
MHRLSEVKEHATAMWILSTSSDFVPVVKLGDKDMPQDEKIRCDMKRVLMEIASEYD